MSDVIFRLPPYRVQHVVTSLSERVDLSISSYGIRELWQQTQGEDIKVAVLDTGCDLDHPDLRDAIVAVKDFSGSHSGANDHDGHGTHTAGTIGARANDLGVIGVAPKCQLGIGKVLGDDGSGAHEWIAAGILWAAEDFGADVISMSLGSGQSSRIIMSALLRATKAGAFVICAAGNDGMPNSVNWPGRREETIAVGAVDRDGRAARFSSRGPQVDIAAPGVDILSTWKRGRYAKLSGTSMATPFVSGVVTLMLSKHRQHGGKTPVVTVADLRQHLQKTARDVGTPGHDDATGWGLIQPEAMLAHDDEPQDEGQEPLFEFGGVRIYSPARKGDALSIGFE